MAGVEEKRRISPTDGVFHMGHQTMRVPMTLFADNRRRLTAELRQHGATNDIVLLQGGSDQGICAGDSSDVGPVFKQESFFHWAFGVLEPDFYGVIVVGSVFSEISFCEADESHLFMPRLPPEYAIWMGSLETTDQVKERYHVDDVHYTDELSTVVAALLNAAGGRVHVLVGTNSDSKKAVLTAHYEGINQLTLDKSDKLYTTMCELRCVKTDAELKVLRYATQVSVAAHLEVMRQIRPGMTEYQCESLFLHHVYSKGGARHVCYNCICGSGASGAVLHYGHAGAPNDQYIHAGDMVLFDMGAEYYRFCSDVTCSYPVNGKFSTNQRLIYEAVLAASRAVISAIEPGVSYREMHLLANRTMLQHLADGGLLTGSVEDMMAANVAGRVFQPHGLGHFIGLDVHDVGGYLDGHPPRDTSSPGLSALRTARVLRERMCLTVEPGCYFIDHLLDAALADASLAKFIVPEKLVQFRGFGGVRIEDDCVVTANGCEVMSVGLPRTVEEIEHFMAEGREH